VGCASPAPAVPQATTPAPTPAAPAPAPLVHVQILAFNDFHGNLEPPEGHDGSVVAPGGGRIAAGGASYLAAHVKSLRRANPNTVVVSAGDLTGASPLVSNLFDDEPTVLLMNQLGLDFEAVGNHDFDRGLAELVRLSKGGTSAVAGGGTNGAKAGSALVARPPFAGARYHYLAANVRGADGNTVFPPYEVRELAGARVAFVGMTLKDTPSVTTRDPVAGLTFADEAATANALLPELRAQGIAATVLLVHEGGFQDEKGSYDSCSGLGGEILPVLRRLDPSFRVVITGHTHQAYDCVIDGRRVTSAASYGRIITAIDLTLDPTRAELVDVAAKNIPVTRDLAPDPDAERLVASYEAMAAPVTQSVIGYQLGPFTRDPGTAGSASCETPLGDLIADAQLAATRSSGAVVAFMNPGGVRTDLVPAADARAAAPVRYAAAFQVQPFGNRLVTLSLSGAQLRQLLEAQFKGSRPRVLSVSKGFSYEYAYDRATRAVTIDPASMKLSGKRVDPAARFRVTVNSFLAGGGDGFTLLRDAEDKTNGVLDIEALVAYLEPTSEKSPIKAGRLDRVRGNACQ
jgi:5'-nucleotidase